MFKLRLVFTVCLALLSAAALTVTTLLPAYADTSHSESGRKAVPGGEIEYFITGSGEPVLLIHGAHVAASFLPVMDESVLDDYRLIRYHRRGYAGSSAAEGPPERFIAAAAADAAALLQQLDIDRAHIVGHSSGALIALQLAMDAPGRVHSLVVLEPPLVEAAEAAGDDPRSDVEQYFGGDPAGAVDTFMRNTISPQWRDEVETLIPGAVDQSERDAATFFELEFPAVAAWSLDAETAQRVSGPVLNVIGTETSPFHQAASALINERIPQSETRRVPGVNHALHMQDSASVAAGIAHFLRRHPISD